MLLNDLRNQVLLRDPQEYEENMQDLLETYLINEGTTQRLFDEMIDSIHTSGTEDCVLVLDFLQFLIQVKSQEGHLGMLASSDQMASIIFVLKEKDLAQETLRRHLAFLLVFTRRGDIMNELISQACLFITEETDPAYNWSLDVVSKVLQRSVQQIDDKTQGHFFKVEMVNDLLRRVERLLSIKIKNMNRKMIFSYLELLAGVAELVKIKKESFTTPSKSLDYNDAILEQIKNHQSIFFEGKGLAHLVIKTLLHVTSDAKFKYNSEVFFLLQKYIKTYGFSSSDIHRVLKSVMSDERKFEVASSKENEIWNQCFQFLEFWLEKCEEILNSDHEIKDKRETMNTAEIIFAHWNSERFEKRIDRKLKMPDSYAAKNRLLIRSLLVMMHREDISEQRSFRKAEIECLCEDLKWVMEVFPSQLATFKKKKIEGFSVLLGGDNIAQSNLKDAKEMVENQLLGLQFLIKNALNILFTSDHFFERILTQLLSILQEGLFTEAIGNFLTELTESAIKKEREYKKWKFFLSLESNMETILRLIGEPQWSIHGVKCIVSFVKKLISKGYLHCTRPDIVYFSLALMHQKANSCVQTTLELCKVIEAIIKDSQEKPNSWLFDGKLVYHASEYLFQVMRQNTIVCKSEVFSLYNSLVQQSECHPQLSTYFSNHHNEVLGLLTLHDLQKIEYGVSANSFLKIGYNIQHVDQVIKIFLSISNVLTMKSILVFLKTMLLQLKSPSYTNLSEKVKLLEFFNQSLTQCEKLKDSYKEEKQEEKLEVNDFQISLIQFAQRVVQELSGQALEGKDDLERRVVAITNKMYHKLGYASQEIKLRMPEYFENYHLYYQKLAKLVAMMFIKKIHDRAADQRLMQQLFTSIGQSLRSAGHKVKKQHKAFQTKKNLILHGNIVKAYEESRAEVFQLKKQYVTKIYDQSL